MSREVDYRVMNRLIYLSHVIIPPEHGKPTLLYQQSLAKTTL